VVSIQKDSSASESASEANSDLREEIEGFEQRIRMRNRNCCIRYLNNCKDDLQQVSSCNEVVTLVFIIIDFLLQNAIIAFYFAYYFTQQPFINEPTRKAYLAFLSFYMIITVGPRFLTILFGRSYEDTGSKCWNFHLKVYLLLLSLINAEYLYLSLFSSFSHMRWSYRNNLMGS
jgi:hypothetical protein